MSTAVIVMLMLATGYIGLSLWLTYLVQQIPRQPVHDVPDWGILSDKRISAIDGGRLEVWRVEPSGPSRGIVVLAHGWGRNRDRMVPRARVFGRWGFTTVMHSARDHGGSSKCRFMNALKFAEDIEAVLDWVGEPVILYGHSAGSAAAILAVSRNPRKIRLLMLEACYVDTKEALRHLYRWVNRFFGFFFAPTIIFLMDLFYGRSMDSISPARLAPRISVPVLLIHGQEDRRFPVRFAHQLKQCFTHPEVTLYVAAGARHSDSSESPDFWPTVKQFIERYLPAEGRASPP